MKKDLISIIIPVYNIEDYVSECIESVIAQTYNNIEIILVDDGSTDSSRKICDKYAKKDNRIIVVHKENGGLSDARNVGINTAKGSYLGFVDGDDLVAPDMYQRLIEEAIVTDSDIATCKFDYYDKNLNTNKKNNEKVLDVCDGFCAIKYLFNDLICGNYAWNKLYKAALFKDTEYPKGKYFEDIFTTYKLFLKANKVVLLNDSLYYYRVRDKQITNAEIVPFALIKDHIEAHECKISNPKLTNYKVLMYKSYLTCLKRCKRLIIQNKVTYINKKDALNFVNNKIDYMIATTQLPLFERVQAKILRAFNHVPILYNISRLKKFFEVWK